MPGNTCTYDLAAWVAQQVKTYLLGLTAHGVHTAQSSLC